MYREVLTYREIECCTVTDFGATNP